MSGGGHALRRGAVLLGAGRSRRLFRGVLPLRAAASPQPRHFASTAGCHSGAVAACTGLVARYEARSSAGLVRRTPAQLSSLVRFERLLGELALAPVAVAGCPAPRGIYIHGDPGAGKTMLMDMFHEAACSRGLPSRRAHFHDFMLDMNRELHRIRKEVGAIRDPMALVARRFVQESRLLCFDECHVLNVGDALLMRAFFERLFEAGGVVVATSNLAPNELYSSGINREVFQPFIEAVLRHCDEIPLTVGEDFRSSRSAELAAASSERAFFWPLGSAADRQLEAAIAALVGTDQRAVAGEIAVPMGRILPCRKMWIDGPVRVAEFSYHELCVKPVGTHDYIALCDNFEVLALTGVPRFGAYDENCARRFASFVDVLYDRHRHLICTTEAEPRELFAAIREQYSGGAEDSAVTAVRMPKTGGSSGKHVTEFMFPGAMKYTDHGAYRPATASGTPVPASKVDGGWVEWSATGLKDASMYDLTCHTKAQQHDRLLPLLRCESRLEEMSYLAGRVEGTGLHGGRGTSA